MGQFKVIGRNYELSVLVDDADMDIIGPYKWRRIIGRSSIVYIAANKRGKTIYLHRLIMGHVDSPRSICIDHIDCNGLNNSRTNLRVTDNRGNQRNARKHLSAKNHSSYKGVTRETYNRTKPWKVYITLSDGRRKYLGYYRTPEDAARAYNNAAIELFGPYARLNDIGPYPG